MPLDGFFAGRASHFFFVNVLTCLPDIYGSVIGQSAQIDPLLFSLRSKLRDEIKLQKDMFSILGTLDLLLAASHAPRRIPVASPTPFLPLTSATAAAATANDDDHDDDAHGADAASDAASSDAGVEEVSLAHATVVKSVPADEETETALGKRKDKTAPPARPVVAAKKKRGQQ